MSPEIQNAIGSNWDEVKDLDWSGFYPVFEIGRGEIIVANVIAADIDTDGFDGFIPVSVFDGGEFEADTSGQHDGFIAVSNYRRAYDELVGGIE